MASALTAFISCEKCGAEFEGVWPVEDGDEQEDPPEALQQCPCGQWQTAAYPGYSFRTEAG